MIPAAGQLADVGERHSGLGEGADLDQLDNVVGGVSAVTGGVAAWLGQRALLVVDPDMCS